jgi:serralysin
MTALGAAGNFSAGDARFAANSTGTAQDASDRVIYETDTRQLWYDADGNGAGARTLIATLQSGATLAATDIVVEGGGPAPIVGTEGDDTLDGTAGDDTIDGLGGNDVMRGFEGADSLRGGAGNDTLWSFWELSEHEPDFAADTLDGGFGDDEYNVNDDGDLILADPGGIDTVVAWDDWTLGAGLENLRLESLVGDGTGNDLANRILSAHGGGTIRGLGGNDTLIVRNGDAAVGAHGGDGDDTLFGGQHQDSLFGDAGNDLLVSGVGGFGVLDGGAGNDTLEGPLKDRIAFSAAPGATNADLVNGFSAGAADIVLDGAVHASAGPSGRFTVGDARFAANSSGAAQDASDRVVYNTSNGQLWYDVDGNGSAAAQLIATFQDAPTFAATDIVVINGSTGGQVINGTAGDDTLSGTAGDDTINGLGGNDLVLAGSSGGADLIDGGAGRDSIEFKERATSAVVVDYANGTITGGSSGTISFASIERVVAGNFDDSLTGNAAAQNLTGQIGSDTLSGAGGLDTLWGGVGSDTFVFRDMGTANADRVADFVSGTDKLHLDDAAFTALGAEGAFSAGDARFAAGAGFTSAQDASDRVVYDTSTGSLYYDADGNGAGAAQLIATFTGNPSITATDIVVI